MAWTVAAADDEDSIVAGDDVLEHWQPDVIDVVWLQLEMELIQDQSLTDYCRMNSQRPSPQRWPRTKQNRIQQHGYP